MPEEPAPVAPAKPPEQATPSLADDITNSVIRFTLVLLAAGLLYVLSDVPAVVVMCGGFLMQAYGYWFGGK